MIKECLTLSDTRKMLYDSGVSLGLVKCRGAVGSAELPSPLQSPLLYEPFLAFLALSITAVLHSHAIVNFSFANSLIIG